MATADRVRAIVVHHRNSELLDHCLRALLASTGVELDVVLFENECHEALPEWILPSRSTLRSPRPWRPSSPRRSLPRVRMPGAMPSTS